MRSTVYLFVILSLLCVIASCGGGVTGSTAEEDDVNTETIPDGSAFMSIDKKTTSEAVISVDIDNYRLDSYIDDCLYIYISGTDVQTSTQSVSSSASYTIWDPDIYGDNARDSGCTEYGADDEDYVSEIAIRSGTFSFDESITITLVHSEDCTGGSGYIYQIEEVLN